MAEGFKIADAYVEVEAEIDEAEVYRTSSTIGESAGLNLGDKLSAGVRTRLRDDRGRFRKDGEGVGEGLGEGAGRSMGRTLGSVLSGHLPTIFSNPYVLGAATAAGALLAPALGAGLAGALIGGTGLGVIAGGIALIADDPRITKAGTKIKDKLLGGLKRGAKPLIQPVLNALGIFDKALDRILPKIDTMFSTLAKSGAIEGLATGLVGLVENALPGMLKLVEASGPFLKNIGPGLAELGKGISFFADQVASVGPEATVFFNDLFRFLSGQIAMWGAIIKFLTIAYSKIRLFFTSIPGWVSAAGSWFSNLWSGIVAKGSAVLGWFQALPGRIGGFISGVAASVTARGAAIIGWFQALPGRIGAFLSTLPGRMRALFLQVFDTATTAIGFGIGTIVKMWLQLPGKIYNAAVSLISRVRSLFTQARTAAISLATSTISSVISFWRNLPGRAYSAAVSLVARIRSIFTQARSTATSTASSLVSSVINIVRTLPGRAASAVASFASAIGGKLRAAASAAYGIGQDIVRGVINGITSMVGAAISAARRAAGNIVSGFKGALGIGSPSKVMAREVGRWILPGVGAGVESSIPAAKRAVQSAADSLVPRVPGVASPGLSGALSGSGAGTNYYFAPGSITIDAGSLRSIQDLLKMIDRLESSARAMRPRMATVGA